MRLLRKSLNTIFHVIIGALKAVVVEYAVAGGPRFNDFIQFQFIHSLNLLRLIIRRAIVLHINNPAGAVPPLAAVYVLAKYDIAHYSRLKGVV